MRIWEDISHDFISGLPKSQGYDVILVVVDQLTKYAHFMPLSHPYTAKLFCKEIVCLHGMPHSIVSDRDSFFLSGLCYHVLARNTPFKLVYGREPPPLVPYVKGKTAVAELEEQLELRDDMLRILRDNLLKAQNRMKVQADRHRCDLQFAPGDVVWLRLQPYRQKTLAQRKFEKLSPGFFGPYKILR
ncbi:uncharacterized protein LOC114763305 [Neltuma alba]|uniref:uncharacterized protein LOC114763305 n=1 Tax=Neltuma alba TaxID=207710 RepID=UPI0010A55C41|nr:uncharacterized protein LOC114763305 [Prosopis alba]